MERQRLGGHSRCARSVCVRVSDSSDASVRDEDVCGVRGSRSDRYGVPWSDPVLGTGYSSSRTGWASMLGSGMARVLAPCVAEAGGAGRAPGAAAPLSADERVVREIRNRPNGADVSSLRAHPYVRESRRSTDHPPTAAGWRLWSVGDRQPFPDGTRGQYNQQGAHLAQGLFLIRPPPDPQCLIPEAPEGICPGPDRPAGTGAWPDAICRAGPKGTRRRHRACPAATELHGEQDKLPQVS